MKNNCQNKFKVITITTGLILIVLGILCVQYFQSFVDSVIASRLPLKQNTETFELWRKPPATPMLRVYFFNVTNAEEFMSNPGGGVKLKLQEFGPYTYSEKWEKVDPIWHANGTLTYRQNKTFWFERALSIGDESDKYMFPNVPFLSAIHQAKYSSGLDRMALPALLDILRLKPFIQKSVADIMWGYDDPLIKLGKNFAKPGKQKIPFDKFGLFYNKNGTAGQPFTVSTGQEILSDFARINVWNGKTKLNFWTLDKDSTKGGDSETEPISQDYCNMINGTDATGFPAMLNKESVLYIFNPDLCRSIKLVYKEDIKRQDLPTYRFVPHNSTFGDVETYPENQCYCPDGPPHCARRGTFNVSVCQFGSPVFLSWPHFLHGDPSLIEEIDGMSPDPEKHQFYLDIQPKLGIPLQAKGRVQINIQMSRIKEIPQGAKLTDVLIPLIWFEDGIDQMPEQVISLVRQAVYIPEIAEFGLRVACFGFGFLLVICGSIVFLKLLRKNDPVVDETNGGDIILKVQLGETKEKPTIDEANANDSNGNGKSQDPENETIPTVIATANGNSNKLSTYRETST